MVMTMMTMIAMISSIIMLKMMMMQYIRKSHNGIFLYIIFSKLKKVLNLIYRITMKLFNFIQIYIYIYMSY